MEDDKWERQNGNKLISKLVSENDKCYKKCNRMERSGGVLSMARKSRMGSLRS